MIIDMMKTNTMTGSIKAKKVITIINIKRERINGKIRN
jgi:hypothetical protein